MGEWENGKDSCIQASHTTICTAVNQGSNICGLNLMSHTIGVMVDSAAMACCGVQAEALDIDCCKKVLGQYP